MRNDLREVSAFATVAEERRFTRAAARLGISQSALRHFEVLGADMFQGFWHVGGSRYRKAVLLQYFAQRNANQFIIINQQNPNQGHCTPIRGVTLPHPTYE